MYGRRRSCRNNCLQAAQQLARLCENSGLWGASPKNGIEGSKKWGRSACARQALGVEVGTRFAIPGLSHSLSLQPWKGTRICD